MKLDIWKCDAVLKASYYLNNDGITLVSAKIAFTDKTCDELFEMQIDSTDGIIGWYTTDDTRQLQMAGVIESS